MDNNNHLSNQLWQEIDRIKSMAILEKNEEKSVQIAIDEIVKLTSIDDIQIFRTDKKTSIMQLYAKHKSKTLISKNKIDNNKILSLNIETDKYIYTLFIKKNKGLVDKEKISFIISNIIKIVLIEKEYINSLKNMAYFDALTGVYSRMYYNKYVDTKMKKQKIVVTVMDLFRLHYINNTFDHIAGDNYIIEASNALKTVCDENDIIFRTGGDEFVIISVKSNTKKMTQKIEKANEIIKESTLAKKINADLLINYGVAEGKDNYNGLLKEAEAKLKASKDEIYKKLGFERRAPRKIKSSEKEIK